MKITGGVKWTIDVNNQFEDIPNWVLKLTNVNKYYFLIVCLIIIILTILYFIG